MYITRGGEGNCPRRPLGGEPQRSDTLYSLTHPTTQVEHYWEDTTPGSILTLILSASEEGESADLKTILEELKTSAVPDIPGLLSLPDANGDPALSLASLFGHEECVKLLIAAGAPVTVRDKEGAGTPLHHAAAGGYLSICELLIEKGAEVNAKDDDGETALHTAARGGHLETVKFLVEKGADISLRSTGFKTAADEAGEDAPDVKAFLEELEGELEAQKAKDAE